jgi:uncharacterized alpha-E superfamily protein
LLPVLHLIVLDASNPHAVVFQVRDLLRDLEASAEELLASMPDTGLAAAGQALSAVDLAAFDTEDPSPACAALAALLAEARAAAFRLSDALHDQFFSHAGTPAPTGL